MFRNVWGEAQPFLVRVLDRAVNRGLDALGTLVAEARRRMPPGRWPRAAAGANPVVLVHGYGADVGSLAFIRRQLEADGFRVYPIDLDSVNLRVEELTRILAQDIEEILAATGAARVDAIGHSLGGIILRYYIQMLDGDRRVARCITVATPHRNGTYASYLVYPLEILGLHPLPPSYQGAASQLLPGSDLFRLLNSAEGNVSRLARVDFTTVYSLTDELIIPPTNAHLDGVRNRRFFLKGHVQLVVSPAVYRYILDRLLAPWTGDGGPS